MSTGSKIFNQITFGLLMIMLTGGFCIAYAKHIKLAYFTPIRGFLKAKQDYEVNKDKSILFFGILSQLCILALFIFNLFKILEWE